jgi:hypothetical protein
MGFPVWAATHGVAVRRFTPMSGFAMRFTTATVRRLGQGGGAA